MPLAARLARFGPASESLTVADIPGPGPGPDEVVIGMLAAPVNPADINVIEGTYGDLPALPATIGNEGVGRVVETGSNVRHLFPGQMVLPWPSGPGAPGWSSLRRTSFRSPTDWIISRPPC